MVRVLKRTLLLTAWVWALGLSAEAQMPFLMSDTTVTNCVGELTDSGGPEEAYGNNENFVFIVDAGSPLNIAFEGAIDLEAAAPGTGQLFDYLVLFDGPDANAPALDTLFGFISNPPTYTTTGPLTVVFVSDASAQPQGFHLTWNATPLPPTPPVVSVAPLGNCPHEALNVTLDVPVGCTDVNWGSFSILGEDGTAWIVDSAAAEALCPGTETQNLFLPLENPIEGNCPFALTFTAGRRDACDSLWLFSLSTAGETSSCPADPFLTADADTLCTGGCTTLEAFPRGCGNTQLTWSGSDGSGFNGPGPWSVCPSQTTTYTASAFETGTGLTGSASITIAVIQLGAFAPDTSLCPGEQLVLGPGTTPGTWSGPGLVSGLPWTFDADSSGSGVHVLTFTAAGSASCSTETEVQVIDFNVPANIATCPESPPFVPQAQPPGGTWTGPGITDGTFDPSDVTDATGEALVQGTYAAQGCTATASFHVQPAGPPLDLGQVCQSEPEMPLPFLPPGGWWSGAGVSPNANSLIPADAPPGNLTLTYNMAGCHGTATAVVLPIDAGPTSTSCPEQSAFVPYPSFFPTGGQWTGPGIEPGAAATGTYDPGLVADGQWAPLVYLAPNGCSDTLWMFNRQTAVSPSVFHACRSDEVELLSEVVQASPWCGQWTTATGMVNNLGGCQWAASSSGFDVGAHALTYTVNGCSDSLTLVIHPDSLDLQPWVACSGDSTVELPSVPLGGQWTGNGILPSADDGLPWSWSPGLAGPGVHPLTWTSPAGCTDAVTAEVEAPAQWEAPSEAVFCHNDQPFSAPDPIVVGVHEGEATEQWYWDGNPWVHDTTWAQLGAGLHTASVQWSALACAFDTSWTVEVLPPLSLSLEAEDLTLCPGEGTAAFGMVSGGLLTQEGAPPLLTVSWSDGGPALLERILLPETSGWWSLTAEDGCSSPAVDSLYLNVLPPFDAQVTFGTLACHGDSSSLLLEGMAPAGLSHMVNGDSLGLGPHLWSGTAGEVLSWTLMDPIEGCSLDTVLLVPSHPVLTAAFSVSPAADCIPWDAQPLSIIDLSAGATAGQWTWNALDAEDGQATGDTLPWNLGTNPTLSVPTAGQWAFQQVVMQDAGCTDTLTQTVCVLPPAQFWLPDAFSPNGDGANDRLRPRGSGIASWTMRIFDRWGVEVWKESQENLPAGAALAPTTAEGFPIGWDGEGASAGVYVVRVEGKTDGGSPIAMEQPVRLVR